MVFVFMNSLQIRSITAGRVLRSVSFHLGANFVVDKGSSQRHNKVGKTTFLRLIDVLMGAKAKSYVYKDADTGAINQQLKDFIDSNKIAVELSLVDSLEGLSASTVQLRVDLFPRGGYYIDSEKVSRETYVRRLNELLFDIDNNTPTFRELIAFFVRVSVGGDRTSFLKALPGPVSNSVYRSVYNFLFGISDPEIDRQLGELRAELRRSTEVERRYKNVYGVGDVTTQEQVLDALLTEQRSVQAALDDIIDSEVYQSNRAQIAEVRQDYSSLTERISELEYRIEQNEEAIKKAKSDSAHQVDLNLTRRFYDEVCSMLPSVNASFEQMVEFNRKLIENRITYFDEIGQELIRERDELLRSRSLLASENEGLMSIVIRDRVDEYERLYKRASEVSQQIGTCRAIVKTLEDYQKEQETLNKRIADAEARANREGEYKEQMLAFNKYFKELAASINDESPLLVYEPDTLRFPVRLVEMPGGSSTGTKKSLLAAYDLAYQRFAEGAGVKTPRYVVHDILESIEGDDLRVIVEEAKRTDCQYVVAILKEKLDSSCISEPDQSDLTILELSDNDRLFEGSSNPDIYAQTDGVAASGPDRQPALALIYEEA